MIKAGIVGFRGYSGVELQRILARHGRVSPYLLEHRVDGAAEVQAIGRSGLPRIGSAPDSVVEAGIEVVFLATPADVSMEVSAGLLERGVRVVDLSGAFRLKTVERYEHWYKEAHTQAGWLDKAVYGLPEVSREGIAGARLLSNPGCYPTAASLAIRPLVASGAADRGAGIVCDAKSGVSGAGRKPSLKTSFCEVSSNFSAYSILNHRHVPEVLQNTGLEESEFTFTAHLIPTDRGILETIYFRGAGLGSAADLERIYLDAYRDEPFVRIFGGGVVPDLLSVAHTNYCDIGFRYDAATRRGVVVAAIDNLVKGAAGQAVQNMNLMFGFGETEGLL